MSDLEARREARRRKILENSKSRLSKITGESGDEGEPSSNFSIYAHAEEPSIVQKEQLDRHKHKSTISFVEDENVISEPPSHMQNINYPHSPSVMVNDTSNLKIQKRAVVFTISLCYSVFLIVLDFLRINNDLWFANKIFLPFITLECIYFSIATDTFKTINVYNLKNAPLMVYLKLLQGIFNLFQDLMIYFMTFILVQKFVIISSVILGIQM